ACRALPPSGVTARSARLALPWRALSLCRRLFLPPDDVVRLRIKRRGAATRDPQRLRRRADRQEVDTGEQSAGLLQHKARGVAPADVLFDLPRALAVGPQRFERIAAEHDRGFVGLAHFVID